MTDALVVAQGQRGFRVAPISLADFADITQTRVLLETEALRQAMALGDDAWEAEVLAAFHRLSRAEEKLGAYDEAREEWEGRNREALRKMPEDYFEGGPKLAARNGRKVGPRTR